MQICENCGKNIRYIPLNESISACCDYEETDFVTKHGRKTTGYKIHRCIKENEKNKEDHK